MEALFEVLSDYYQIMLSYPLYYYGFFFLILGAAIVIYIRKKYNIQNRIKIINSLLKNNPEKALKKISSSKLEVIDYFLTPEKVKSGHYVKITDFFSRPERLKQIYNKIFSKKHKREYYCELGINIFSRLKTPQSAEYLITFLYEDNQELVVKTIDALRNFEYDKIIYSLLEVLESKPEPKILSHMEDIFKSSSENAEKLLSYAREANPKIKSWCLDIFAEFPEEKFYSIILEFLNSDNPELKIKSIKKMEDFIDSREEEIYSRLLNFLDHDNEKIRAETIKTLKKIHFNKTADHIAEHLRDESSLVRQVATEALMDMGDEGLKYLLDTAKEPKEPKEVIQCLEKQGIPFLIKAVEKLNINQQHNQQNLNIS